MKTKLFVLTAMFIGGLLFSSCQKDNALLEDNAFSKDQTMIESTIDPGPSPVEQDPLKNYPDPFLNTTTIEYVLNKNAWVKLSVNNDETGLVQILVNGLQARGVHYIEFNSSGMPAGVYEAQLTIGDKVFRELMTKKSVEFAKDDPNSGLSN